MNDFQIRSWWWLLLLSAWGAMNPALTTPAQESYRLTVPPLREQVSLNGPWDQGGIVPQYFGEKINAKIYQRQVKVPPAWAGKIFRIEFQQVNFIADVYINDQFVTNHIGGWIPFAVEVPETIPAGQSFTLRVEVKSATHEPYVDGEGRPLWPVGLYNLDDSYTGIVDDVWLRAYGRISIEEAFVQTYTRERIIAVDYLVRNRDKTNRTVSIKAAIAPARGIPVQKVFYSAPVEVPAGETKTITICEWWWNPTLWTPEQPYLYHITSTLWQEYVLRNSTLLDEETRQFGFRQIWIEGNQYMLNGVRLNLIGDSIPRSWCDQTFLTPSAWPSTVDMLMKDMNLRIIRWHQFPAAEYLLDVADQKGLLIIDESALYGRPWHKVNQPTVIANLTNSWIPAWIKGHRNHPSIILWSAENEDYQHVGGYTPVQLKALADTIRQVDGTRPVIHDGDEDLDGLAKTFNWHYPEGYEKLPTGSIYSWADKVQANKPTGVGEFFACPWVEGIKPEVFWWQGTWVRGMRYVNFTDIRPFVMHWAWTNNENGARQNLRNSFAKVALFDKDYDDLGIAPLLHKQYPSLDEGATVTRNLVVYNDAFSGTRVKVGVYLQSGGHIYHVTGRTFEVGLGAHRDISCTFVVPRVQTDTLDMVLTTSKAGKQTFQEARRFIVNKRPPEEPSPKGIVLKAK